MAAIDGPADYSEHREDGAIGCGADLTADHDLDAEVAHFLELEFFAAYGDDAGANGSCFQTSPADKANVLFVKDDVGVLDLIGSFDLPDLEGFSGLGELLVEPQLRNEAVTITEDLQRTSSLLVQIPASVLVSPPLPDITATEAEPSFPIVKKVRKRVKDEIEYLRQKVVDFEEKIEKLQQNPREEEQVALQTDSSSFRQGQFSSQVGSWELVAKRQEDEKQRSETENAKLRETLSKQLQLARSLSSLLNARQDISVCARDLLLYYLNYTLNSDSCAF